jgi:hypothetical protein
MKAGALIRYTLLPLIGLAASAAVAWFLLGVGMGQLHELRQLERTPPSFVGAIIGGETLSRGQAIAIATSDSFYTKTPSIYWAYRHEVEETDSDGNTSWETRDYREQSRNFRLQDGTGSIRVLAADAHDRIDWSVRQSFQVTRGENRYTEWRIEPGQIISVFAMAFERPSGLYLGFTEPGDYTPLITSFGAEHERESKGTWVVFALWGGLAAAALLVYCAVVLLRMHRVWHYLSILTVCLSLLFTYLGLNMLQADLQQGAQRLAQRQVQAQKIMTQGFADGTRLSTEAASLARITLVANQLRLGQQFNRFPDRWLALMWGISPPEVLFELNPAEQQRLLDLRFDQATTELSGWWITALVLVGTVLAMGFSWWGFRHIKYKRMIENVPTQQSIAIVPGISEITGRVTLREGESPLDSPLSHSPCVWFDYLVQERRGSGKNKRWVTVEHEDAYQDFHCRDAEGVLQIKPRGASMISQHVEVQRRGSYRYTEKSLRVDDALYAIGSVRTDDTADRGIVMLDQQDDPDWPFILSNFSEREVMLKKGRVGLLLLNFAFSSLVLAGLLLFANSGSFSPYDFLLTALVAPAYMLLVVVALHYNDLVFLRRRADRDWSNIEVALKKRKNLIPRLQVIVKQYMAHESKLQQHLVKLRDANQRMLSEPDGAARYFRYESAVLTSVQVRIEQYPQLQAEPMVGDMMDKITALETEIAFLRQGYNNSVTQYNERVETFPDLFLARAFKFERQSRFAV